MTDPAVLTLTILVAVLVVLVFFLLLVAASANGRLRRLELQLAKRDDPAPRQELPKSPRHSLREGEFAAFLEADPARRKLSKSEQFSAYRVWRKEKGLSWSK